MTERPFITPSAETLGRVAYSAWRSSRDLGTEWEHLTEEVRGHWRFVGLTVAQAVQKRNEVRPIDDTDPRQYKMTED